MMWYFIFGGVIAVILYRSYRHIQKVRAKKMLLELKSQVVNENSNIDRNELWEKWNKLPNSSDVYSWDLYNEVYLLLRGMK